MSWKVTDVVTKRLEFVLRREAGERMSDLCREYEISRKTGYKFWNRYKEKGREGLGDYSRRPLRHPNRTPAEIEELVVRAREAHPTWGPKKLRVFLRDRHPGVPIPAASTIGELLKKNALVRPRRRVRRATPTPLRDLTKPESPNDVWCADFKGQFKTKDGKYCFPLTITDLHSRYILACDALENTRTGGAYAVFAQAFETYGLPKVIRTDNGPPFASTGLLGLSRLSVWWRRLGIRPERIEPGQPQQNGSHERMHLTLKQDTTRPPGANGLQQQEKFDDFRVTFNELRPHEALDMRCPAALYEFSPREFPDYIEEPTYPLHDVTRRVQRGGHLHVPGLNGWQPYICMSLANEVVGLRELEPQKWLLSYLDLDLGTIDGDRRRFEPLGQP